MKFDIKKVYLKDASFESPNSPSVFTNAGHTPQLNIEMSVAHAPVSDDASHYDVVLSVTVTAAAEDQTVFLAELQQAGVFQVEDVTADQLAMVLEVACPNMLLPFAREAVADLTTKGGFPQVLLAPVNFEAMYRSKHAAVNVPSAGADEQSTPGRDTG